MSATSHAGRDLPSVDPLDADDAPASGHPFHTVCPYLLAADGEWRSNQPMRDHRCTAMQPAAAPALSKQRELCLRAAHVTCATYRTARALEAEAAPSGSAPDGSLWPPTTATVLALEQPRARAFRLGGSRARSAGQVSLVALMLVAFGVLVIARTTAPPGAPGASAAAGVASTASAGGSSPEAVVSPSMTPVVTPSPTAAPPSPSPSASPSATPAPTATPAETYKVKSGDTLSSIAATHGTTVRKLKKANDLTSNLIHVGQVLVIP